MRRGVSTSKLARDLAAGIGAGRQLVALLDGPSAHRWYWEDDLAGMQRAARRYPLDHPSGMLRGYVRTSRTVKHPTEPEFSGAGYSYRPAEVARRDQAAVPAPRRSTEDVSRVSRMSRVSQVPSQVAFDLRKRHVTVAGDAT